jgi:hypothetical protein
MVALFSQSDVIAHPVACSQRAAGFLLKKRCRVFNLHQHFNDLLSCCMTSDEFINIISGGRLERTEKRGWLSHEDPPVYVSGAVAFSKLQCWIEALPKETKDSVYSRILAYFKRTAGENWFPVAHDFIANAPPSERIDTYCRAIFEMIESGEINPPNSLHSFPHEIRG